MMEREGFVALAAIQVYPQLAAEGWVGPEAAKEAWRRAEELAAAAPKAQQDLWNGV